VKLAIGVMFLLGVSSAAFASAITVTLDSTTLSGLPGAVVTFTGTLANTTGVTENLNNANLSGLLPSFTGDVTPFFNNAPLFLTANQSTASIGLFTVTIPNVIAPGPYTGFFSVFGGPGVNDQTLLGSSPTFTVNVTSTAPGTPEPASLGFALAGLAAMGMLRLSTSGKER